MAVVRTKALILRHLPEREYDRVLTVLTPDHGQMRVRARGTKKSISKLGGSLEPLTEVDLSLANGRHLDQVIGSVVINRFANLRNEPTTIVAAQWFLELVERITKPGQVGSGLYDLVIRELQTLRTETEKTPGALWLELCRKAWRVIDHEGFAPAMDRCAKCHKPLADTEPAAYEHMIGFVHRAEQSPNALQCDPAALDVLRGQGPIVADRTIFRQVHAVLEDVLHRTIDRPLNSEVVLRAILRSTALSAV
jgi:DNA repair protein RecO (recombination protein O)